MTTMQSGQTIDTRQSTLLTTMTTMQSGQTIDTRQSTLLTTTTMQSGQTIDTRQSTLLTTTTTNGEWTEFLYRADRLFTQDNHHVYYPLPQLCNLNRLFT